MEGAPPPPPPPPHGSSTPKPSSGLPPGNYDIFIIPPHSSGSGFLYLPSMRPNTNSFIAGAACAFFCCWLYSIIAPTCKTVLQSISQSGNGPAMVVFLVLVGGGAWYLGRMGQLPGPHGDGSAGGAHQPPPQNGYPRGGPNPQHAGGAGYQGTPPPGATGAGWGGPNAHAHGGAGFAGGYQQHQYDQSSRPPPPRTEPYGHTPRSESDSSERPKPRTRAYSNGSERWAKAKEETRQREAAKKRAEDLQKRREEEEKKKQEEERRKAAEASKVEWERKLMREKETREREAREKAARERVEQEAKEAKEKAEREARAQMAKERLEKAKSEKSGPTFGKGERTNPYDVANSNSPTPAAMAAQLAASQAAEQKLYERPSAQSYAGTSTEQSYRPYDKARPKHASSGSSFYSSYSESYAPSQSTARTSPPPSQRGPYKSTDPDKVQILGVYRFSDSFPGKPEISLVAGQDGWSDGIVLKIQTEGLFVDDDVKGQGLREWDVKAWKLSEVETTATPTNGLHIVKFKIKDAAKSRYIFILNASEEHKVTAGVRRLKGSSLVQRLVTGAISANEAGKILQQVGL